MRIVPDWRNLLAIVAVGVVAGTGWGWRAGVIAGLALLVLAPQRIES